MKKIASILISFILFSQVFAGEILIEKYYNPETSDSGIVQFNNKVNINLLAKRDDVFYLSGLWSNRNGGLLPYVTIRDKNNMTVKETLEEFVIRLKEGKKQGTIIFDDAADLSEQSVNMIDKMIKNNSFEVFYENLNDISSKKYDLSEFKIIVHYRQDPIVINSNKSYFKRRSKRIAINSVETEKLKHALKDFKIKNPKYISDEDFKKLEQDQDRLAKIRIMERTLQETGVVVPDSDLIREPIYTDHHRDYDKQYKKIGTAIGDYWSKFRFNSRPLTIASFDSENWSVREAVKMYAQSSFDGNFLNLNNFSMSSLDSFLVKNKFGEGVVYINVKTAKDLNSKKYKKLFKILNRKTYYVGGYDVDLRDFLFVINIEDSIDKKIEVASLERTLSSLKVEGLGIDKSGREITPMSFKSVLGETKHQNSCYSVISKFFTRAVI